MIRAIVVASAIVIAACVSAGMNVGAGDAQKQDTPVHFDTHSLTADTPPPNDGPPPGDASVDAFLPKDAPPTPDAGGGNFCSDNTGCAGGFCCWFALCVAGTGVGSNLCFPTM